MQAEDKDNTEKIMKEIRESKLSGRYFFQKWRPFGKRRPWRKAFRNLTGQEMLKLLENIAKLSSSCQNQQQYDQITSCYQFLQKGRLMDQLVKELQNRKIKITQEMSYNNCLIIQEKVRKRVEQLGLNRPFQEIMQLNKSKKKAEEAQKEQSFSQNLQQKSSKSMKNLNEPPQSFFTKLKRLFFRQKSSIKQSVPEHSMQYIQLVNNENEYS